MESKYSVVEYIPDSKGGSCGYCKSSDTNYNLGIWAHTLSVEDYQDLIDRGWRRSGQYCYKPSLTITCCPLYTIKCDALNLKLSKSQKKLLKRVANYLNSGKSASCKDAQAHEIEGSSETEISGSNIYDKRMSKIIEEKSSNESPTLKDVDIQMEKVECIEPRLFHSPEERLISPAYEAQESEISPCSSSPEKKCLKNPRPGLGIDATKPVCKKAKLLRFENKQKKLEKKGLGLDNIEKRVQKEKSLEDFIAESNNENSINKLEIRLVSSLSGKDALRESWKLYAKYQMAIHKETRDECDFSTFYSFLVASPLQPQKSSKGPPSGYGSFHQQYWLNGKLIAVGVIDVLPKCVSSVYFFYDPDYSFLSLGTYGSLREIEFVRKLCEVSPDISSYYMGYYIHTCPKMRYKARFSPSYLLCPEVYTWHPFEKCQEKLDRAKYSRFNDDKDAVCEDSYINLNKVLVLWKQIAMPYSSYKMRARTLGSNEDEEVKQYAELVGRKCAERMLLYRS